MSKTLCIFSSLYAPHIGGVETFTRNIARQLAACGLRVIVVTCQLDPAHPEHAYDEGVEVVRLACRPLMNARFPWPLSNVATRTIWSELDAAAPDYAIINTRFYPLSLAAARFCTTHKIRPVIIDHGSAHLTVGNAAVDAGVQAVEHALTRKLKTYPSDYYGVSQASVTWLQHFGIQAQGTINNAIDAQAFANARSERSFRAECGLSPDDFLVCSVGRLAPEKGCRQLVETARLLAKTPATCPPAANATGTSSGTPTHPQEAKPAGCSSGAPAIKFILAGSGPLAGELQRNAPSNVRFTGPLAPPDVAALLCEADLMCMPTRSEGFSTALLEAAACETPALITNVGGVAELIPAPAFGTLLEDARPETIARHLRELAADPTRCKSQGLAVRARVDELFSWEATATRALAACERANSETTLPAC